MYLFTFPLRLAALKPEGFLTEGFSNEEPPLLPLGAAAAKRYIYHRYQHQIKALPGLCEDYLNNRNYRVDRDNIDTTRMALRRYGHADSVTLFRILLSRLLSVK